MDFDLIYEQYFLDVYRFIFSLSRDEKISEDITQETFLKAMKNIKKFKGECDIKFWLFQIAKNTYFTYSKKVKIEKDNITLKYQEYEKVSKWNRQGRGYRKGASQDSWVPEAWVQLYRADDKDSQGAGSSIQHH